MVVAPVQTDELLVNLARWVRRLIIPLAVLAWSGVALLILWTAGHVTKTLLLLVIAALFAYALSPLVTLLARVLPRFLAVLVVYLLVLLAVGALLYLIISTAIVQVTSLSSYLGFLLTPGASTHPTALEQTLRSFGITTAQLASLRAQIISTAEGLSRDVVPLLTGVADSLLNIILVTVLSVYLLVDGARVSRWFRQNMPYRQRGRVRFLLETLQRVVGGYIRG
ncbi:MAG: AI-2E family transporter, partial [Chloroflexi bacterium]